MNSDKDIAIEFGRSLATSAQELIKSIGHLEQQRVLRRDHLNTSHDVDRAADLLVDAIARTKSCIHEFEKRADSASKTS